MYYLDAGTLSAATSIFLDSLLTTVAPDGFYSDTIVTREMVGGVLLPAQECLSCANACDNPITSALGPGLYQIDTNTGTAVGAIRVYFNPLSKPNGIKAVYNGQVYNKLSSPLDGVHQSTGPLNYTFVGESSDDCGISGTTYPALPVYEYKPGGTFELQPLTQALTVNAGDVSLSAGPSVGSMLMVIPKTSATPSIINLYVAAPCDDDNFSINISCPEPLMPFQSSLPVAGCEEACAASITQQYYVATLSGGTTVGIYDYVFYDGFGQTSLPDGFYGVWINEVHQCMQVVNGVIVSLTNCGGCMDFYICVNEDARNTIRFTYTDCDGVSQIRNVGPGACTCIQTTAAGFIAMTYVWADGYTPDPTAADFTATINGCP